MKFYISYFYNVRFLKPNMLPLSTAQYDPKWFHNGKGEKNLFLDKNLVINGARATFLVFPKEQWALLEHEEQCRKDCPLMGTDCAFMKRYYAHLNSFDFDKWKASAEYYPQVVLDALRNHKLWLLRYKAYNNCYK